MFIIDRLTLCSMLILFDSNNSQIVFVYLFCFPGLFGAIKYKIFLPSFLVLNRKYLTATSENLC